MKLAAANAIASLVPDDQLSENFILPEAFNPEVSEVVSKAVKKTYNTRFKKDCIHACMKTQSFL